MVRSRLTIPIAGLLCAGALALPAGAAATSSCANAAATPSPSTMPAVRTAVLCLLNVQRTEHGLHALHANASLGHAATKYSLAMVHEGFFNHVSPGGSTLTSRIDQTSYLHGARSWALGENIAYGTGSQSTAAEMVSAWMHSAGHRANILNPTYRDIGIGAALGAPVQVTGASAKTAATYTTDFGQRSH
jgi:uncharacterized protein YkwD